ncbi:MAG: DNA repair protein RecN [Nitrospirota bacterium]
MLRELRIRNLAIIDDLTVSFGKGLNVLTGETGAGKSIIVDSLGLALGSRAQSDLVRSGEKEAVVQAYFEISDYRPPSDIDMNLSDELILRRSVSASGRSRAFVNDTMVSLQSLAEIGKCLVDIHGQHEHQSLLSVDRHRDFLDSFGKLTEECRKVQSLYEEVHTLRTEEGALKQKVRERAQRLDLLRFQINEIDSAQVKDGEKEKLIGERTIAANVSRLNELAGTAYSLVYGSEGSCIEALSLLITKVKEMAAIDPSASEILQALESGRPLIEDAALALRKQKELYDVDPERLDRIEERLEVIKKLEKKYGGQIDKYRQDAEAELEALAAADALLDTVEAKLAEKEALLIQAAETLSEKRKKAAGIMETLIKAELRELAMQDAEFIIDIARAPLSAYGHDTVEFLFSANPGEAARPLVKIASGGELSRVMLAVKSILADFDNADVLIFDEVDAGIGGKTAESVGRKLRRLSSGRQVLCATHLPQVASMGDVHLQIEKRHRSNRVYVEVRGISGEEREREIARMLSGTVTEVSIRHARHLLEEGR